MRYRFLGNSGLQVSEICFGVMTFTGKTGWTHLGIQEQKDADRLTSIATDNGVNFFATINFMATFTVGFCNICRKADA